MTPSEFFVQESASHARTLPLPAALTYLRGMVLLTGENPEAAPVRAAFNNLMESDHQLELIASGQLKLPLSEPSTKKPRCK